MSFRLVPKWMTLNDIERRNGPYYGRRSSNGQGIIFCPVVSSYGRPAYQMRTLYFCRVLSFLWPPYGIGQGTIFLPCGFLWSPYGIGQTIIFSSCGFFLMVALYGIGVGQTIIFLPCGFFFYLSFFFPSSLGHTCKF